VWNGGSTAGPARGAAVEPPGCRAHSQHLPLLSARSCTPAGRGRPVVTTLHNYKLACASGDFFRDGAVCHDCADGAPVGAIRHGATGVGGRHRACRARGRGAPPRLADHVAAYACISGVAARPAPRRRAPGGPGVRPAQHDSGARVGSVTRAPRSSTRAALTPPRASRADGRVGPLPGRQPRPRLSLVIAGSGRLRTRSGPGRRPVRPSASWPA